MVPELLEREAAMQELELAVQASAAGKGRVVLVSGEAGIGKTSLLTEFAQRQAQARILWGSCDALFTPRPLGPLEDIARTCRGPLLAAFKGETSRDRLFGLALEEIARQQSVAIFEDAHWADESTLDLLKFLGRRMAGLGAVLVISYRDDELDTHHPLRFVVGELPRSITRRIALAPLSKSAVAKLAREVGRSAGKLFEITGGNPFYVSEALACEVDEIPATVRDAVLARVSRLPAGARALAEFASVVPGGAEPWLIAAGHGTDPGELSGCVAVGLEVATDGRLRFRHELARRAMEDSLSPPRRQHLHERVLAALAAQDGVAAARLAHHAARADSAPDVLRFAPLAADEAARMGAHRQAVAHLEQAVRHGRAGLAAEVRAALLSRLGEELYLVGEFSRAIDVRQMALCEWRAVGSPREAGCALSALSQLHWYAGAARRPNILPTTPSGCSRNVAQASNFQLPIATSPTSRWRRTHTRLPFGMRCRRSNGRNRAVRRPLPARRWRPWASFG